MEEPLSTASPTGAPDTSMDLSDLTYAIVQIFAIILLGYVAGRIGAVSKMHASGIGRFVSSYCLPALIFRSMCLLQFDEVNWTFLLGIFLAKVAMFLLVTLATLVVKRDLGLAGIFAVYTTLSSDFAFGYPIVEAIYAKTHPRYIQYLYLVQPITLAIGNPIGFIMMEFQNTINAQDQNERGGFGRALLKVLKGIALNPIVNMTLLGIVFNFILNSSIPTVLDRIFMVLAQGFDAGALFYLGLCLVGKIQGKMGMALLVPFLLVVGKSVLLPFLCWGILQRLDTSHNSTSLHMYGFLYGTIPTTPSLYIFATDFGFGADIIATALVLNNAVAAPVMFVSAKMMVLVVDKAQDFQQLLYNTSFHISIASFVCCFWVILLFISTGKWKRMPHRFTMAYMVSIMIACVGVFAFHVQGASNGWLSYPGQALLMVGVFASRFWTAILALVMCALHVESLSGVLRFQKSFYVVGFGIPVIMTCLQLVLGKGDVEHEINPSFHYGTWQALFSLAALLVCFAITMTSLVCWQKEQVRQQTASGTLSQSGIDEPAAAVQTVENSCSEHSLYCSSQSVPTEAAMSEGETTSTGITSAESSETLPESSDKSERIMCHIKHPLSATANACITSLVVDYSYKSTGLGETLISGEDQGGNLAGDYQSNKYLVLLLTLIFSMFLGLILCAWRLFDDYATGTYVEVEFLDMALNYGQLMNFALTFQGILVALVFGFESVGILSPAFRRVCQALSRRRKLPKIYELDESTRERCTHFSNYHLEKCSDEIVEKDRFDARTVHGVFTGSALCHYLISCGLAVDRPAAVQYGDHLLLGRVLTSVTGDLRFQDALTCYRFLEYYSSISDSE